MSFETDAPIRTLCPECSCFVETEGYGIPAWVMGADGTVYHTKCYPELCQHEKELVYDTRPTDSDTEIFKHRCRDCGFTWEVEMLGAQLRAEGEQDDTE